MNKSIILLLIMTFSSLFGDDNVVVRHGDQQVAQGEFIGTYMNHVHILMGDKIIYYACDDIVSITSSSEGFSYGNEFDYDCSKNTVTADILFPPELDPMTGEWTQMLPDVFNPDIPKPAVQKKVSATPVVQKPAAKVEVGSVSAAEDFVIIDGVKYARVTPEKEEKKRKKKTTLSTLEIRSLAIVNAGQTHVGLGWGLLGLAGCGTGLMGGMIGGDMADEPGFFIGGAIGLGLPSVFASAVTPVPYYPNEIKTQNEKQLYKDAYVKAAGRLRVRSTQSGTLVGLLGFGAFMLMLFW